MSTELIPFTDGEFKLAITLHEQDGFRVQAPGLGRALGFREAYDLLRNIPDEEKGSELVRTPGGDQQIGYVTEAGFYRALGQRQAARIPDVDARGAVERFQAWVYREVLPEIRKGTAGLVRLPSSRELAQLVIKEADRADAAEAKVAELEPAADAWNTLAKANGDYAVADAAKVLSRDPSIKIGRDRLFTVLRELRWAYRQEIDGRHRAYQRAIEAGRLSELPSSHYHPRTGELILDPPQVRVTVKGLEYLHQHLGGTAQLRLDLGGVA